MRGNPYQTSSYNRIRHKGKCQKLDRFDPKDLVQMKESKVNRRKDARNNLSIHASENNNTYEVYLGLLQQIATKP